MSTDDPFLQHEIRTLFRLARHLQRRDEIGDAVESADLDDLEQLLGTRPAGVGVAVRVTLCRSRLAVAAQERARDVGAVPERPDHVGVEPDQLPGSADDALDSAEQPRHIGLRSPSIAIQQREQAKRAQGPLDVACRSREHDSDAVAQKLDEGSADGQREHPADSRHLAHPDQHFRHRAGRHFLNKEPLRAEIAAHPIDRRFHGGPVVKAELHRARLGLVHQALDQRPGATRGPATSLMEVGRYQRPPLSASAPLEQIPFYVRVGAGDRLLVR